MVSGQCERLLRAAKSRPFLGASFFLKARKPQEGELRPSRNCLKPFHLHLPPLQGSWAGKNVEVLSVLCSVSQETLILGRQPSEPCLVVLIMATKHNSLPFLLPSPKVTCLSRPCSRSFSHQLRRPCSRSLSHQFSYGSQDWTPIGPGTRVRVYICM